MADYTPQQLQQALQRAQAAGDQQAVQVIQQHMQAAQSAPQAQPQQYSNEQLNHAYWLASMHNDEPAKIAIFRQLRAQGGNLSGIPQTDLPQVERQNAQKVVDNMSGMGKFTAGVGKSFVDTGHGIEQLVGARNLQQANDSANLDEPLMQSGAGLAGDITGQAAQLAVPVGDGLKALGWAGKAAPYIAAAVKSGLFAASQPVTGDQSRLENTAIGAAAGPAGELLGAASGRIAKGLSDKLPQEIKDLYAIAKQKGIPVHFSQLSDSKFVKKLAQMVSYLPLSGSSKAAAAQRDAMTRAVGATFGSPEKTLTDQVMSEAKQRIGNEFQRIHSTNGVQLSTGDISKLNNIANTADRTLSPQKAAIVKKQIDQIISKADENGTIPGLAYHAIRTDELSPLEQSSKPMMKTLIRGIRKTFDKAADRSASPGDAKALANARSQWRNFKTAEKALKRVSGAGGKISPAQLWTLVNQRYGGTPEMRDLAKVGQMLKEGVPDSGSPAGNMILGGAGLSALHPASIPATAGAVGIGATAGRLMNSSLVPEYLVRGSRAAGLLTAPLRAAPYVLPASANALHR